MAWKELINPLHGAQKFLVMVLWDYVLCSSYFSASWPCLNSSYSIQQVYIAPLSTNAKACQGVRDSQPCIHVTISSRFLACQDGYLLDWLAALTDVYMDAHWLVYNIHKLSRPHLNTCKLCQCQLGQTSVLKAIYGDQLLNYGLVIIGKFFMDNGGLVYIRY